MPRAISSVGVLILASLVLASFTQARDDRIPSPSEFLGLDIGADGVLATYDQIVDYWKAVDARSDRIAVQELGTTTLGRPYSAAVVTSPDNQRRLDEYRLLNDRLYDPRTTSDVEARELIARGRTIVAIQMGIHSDEIAAPQTSLELAHRFATDQTPWMRRVLDETIIILSPSHNPDGAQLVAEWHAKTLGTPYYGGPLPFLYHHYAGHDNNRDWYMFTQKESRLTVGRIWNVWHPQISLDVHQMQADGARMFLPPYLDPVDPHIDPIVRSQTRALGSSMAASLIAQGKTGVVTEAIYDLWTPARAYVNYHGGVRILAEVASARLARPMTLSLSGLRPGLGYDPRQVSANFPRVWQGGTWRLRDIMDYEHAAIDALLDHAARNRRSWLANFWEVNKNAVGRGEPRGGPYALVVAAAQRDPLAAHEMLRALQIGGVEVQRALTPFSAGGVHYGAGSHVILMAQPASAFARTLTAIQRYPDIRSYDGGPPRRPYDVTAYTMPLLMGVSVAEVADRFDADLALAPTPLPPAPGIVRPGSAARYVFAHDSAGMRAAIALARDGVSLGWARERFNHQGRTFVPGTFVVPTASGVRQKLAAAAAALPIAVLPLEGAGPAMTPIRLPRVGLYQSYAVSMDEGWTRWIFDDWQMPYVTIRNHDLNPGPGESPAPLTARFDVIVLPDQSATAIVNGIGSGQAPPELVGGIGEAGVAALQGFVEQGGTLVALDSASMLPVTRFGLPVENVVGLAGTGEFYGPGSILRTEVDADHPIGYGSPERGIAWFEDSPAFRLASPARAVVRYPSQDPPLVSGWLLGGERLNGTTAVAEVPLGRGRVVLFGFRPQYRAQTWATLGLFFNALFYSTVPG